ncbi:MAG: aminoacyl-tRNA hydrolase [Betaproteobacteria bacterium]|nr:aminoacyl-tRNA hydrolase [Betaproteobacteria bacterium]
MRLVVGLGNPGREYEATRHNAGFWFVDAIADREGVSLRNESRFHGLVARIARGGRECWLLEPSTYMNASGRAVGALCRFYKIEPQEILVVHDELDLPPGGVKLKKGGGAAGHNGLKDIIAHIGQAFWRLRIGIGHPGDRAQVINFVLQPPRKEEMPGIESAINRSIDVWPMVWEDRMEAAMHALHTRPDAPAADAKPTKEKQ